MESRRCCLTLFLGTLMALAVLTRAANDDRICEGNGAISHMESVLTWRRTWIFDCRPVRGEKTCQESGVVNRLKQTFVYSCPKNHYLSGVRSSQHGMDRKWSFRCCRVDGFSPFINGGTCTRTTLLNDFGHRLNFYAHGDSVIVGLESTFRQLSHFKGDRQWRAMVCRLQD